MNESTHESLTETPAEVAAGQKPCIRCSRAIDAWARICLYCNQDQTAPVAAAAPIPAAVANYRPPEEHGIKQKLAMVGAGILVLFVAFGVGTLINSDDAVETAPPLIAEKPVDDDIVRSGKRADTQLVPDNEPIAPPITSAPAAAPDANTPNEYQRHDATAVSSVEYQQLAARAAAEKKNPATAVDPLSLTGRAYAQPPRPRRRTIVVPPADPSGAQPAAGQSAPSVARTRPVPVYQPVPNIRIRESRTVRLDLMVGADGNVKDVAMRDVIPGQTAAIIAAVQRWRFKPATDNGVPVSAPVTVDLSFRGNE